MIRRSVLFFFLLISPSFGLSVPVAGMKDLRIRIVNYTVNDIIKILGSYRISTEIEFELGEEISHIAIGDSVAWEVAPARNIIFLKPREKSPPTNLQVITLGKTGEQRVYQFELEETDKDPYFVVRFRYPDSLIQKKVVFDLTRVKNWSYTAQGSSDLEPDYIYDDGKVTTMMFSGNRAIPGIYVVDSGNQESMIPWDARENGEVIVVHTVAKEFRLRHGKQVLCIFNEAYNPVGMNFKTGTLSSSVQRVLQHG
jgi:type IV secretion system protein VirB9